MKTSYNTIYQINQLRNIGIPVLILSHIYNIPKANIYSFKDRTIRINKRPKPIVKDNRRIKKLPIKCTHKRIDVKTKYHISQLIRIGISVNKVAYIYQISEQSVKIHAKSFGLTPFGDYPDPVIYYDDITHKNNFFYDVNRCTAFNIVELMHYTKEELMAVLGAKYSVPYSLEHIAITKVNTDDEQTLRKQLKPEHCKGYHLEYDKKTHLLHLYIFTGKDNFRSKLIEDKVQREYDFEVDIDKLQRVY